MSSLSSTQINANTSISVSILVTSPIAPNIGINLVLSFEPKIGNYYLFTCYSRNNEWIVDIGATDHISHFLQNFSTYMSIEPLSVTLLNGLELLTKIARTVKISENLILRDVLYLSEFAFNLI